MLKWNVVGRVLTTAAFAMLSLALGHTLGSLSVSPASAASAEQALGPAQTVGMASPAPAIELQLDLDPTPEGRFNLGITTNASGDERYPQGAAVENAVLLVGTLEGDVGRLPLNLSRVATAGHSSLASLDLERDIVALSPESHWFVVRAEIAYQAGGMSISSAFVERTGAGFEPRSRRQFAQAIAERDR